LRAAAGRWTFLTPHLRCSGRQEATLFEAPASPHLIAFDADVRVADLPTQPPEEMGKREAKKQLAELTDELDDLQRTLYADDRWAVLLVFQALDAAGKDGTIRAVLSGVNPAGCQVRAFGRPSTEELDHDFLWRTVRHLPERGRIGVFNRSYYEEVLVVRANPSILRSQRLPFATDETELWRRRYESIRDHELHLARNGTAIIKFWLNVSRDEQRRRFLDRLQEPEKNWKFSAADVQERGRWDAYMGAYEDALAATSRSWAPWYAIPADDKRYMRVAVAGIVVDALRSLKLSYPTVDDAERARFTEMKAMLDAEGGGD
jgi:PPK2 family polyphosphate:nucleotide phosphotransferase